MKPVYRYNKKINVYTVDPDRTTKVVSFLVISSRFKEVWTVLSFTRVVTSHTS